jgi:hypothetical protein
LKHNVGYTTPNNTHVLYLVNLLISYIALSLAGIRNDFNNKMWNQGVTGICPKTPLLKCMVLHHFIQHFYLTYLLKRGYNDFNTSESATQLVLLEYLNKDEYF